MSGALPPCAPGTRLSADAARRATATTQARRPAGCTAPSQPRAGRRSARQPRGKLSNPGHSGTAHRVFAVHVSAVRQRASDAIQVARLCSGVQRRHGGREAPAKTARERAARGAATIETRAKDARETRQTRHAPRRTGGRLITTPGRVLFAASANRKAYNSDSHAHSWSFCGPPDAHSARPGPGRASKAPGCSGSSRIAHLLPNAPHLDSAA